MALSEKLESKIKTYLGSLSPNAIEALVRNLERSKTKQNADPNLQLILSAAVNLLRKQNVKSETLPGGEQRRSQIQRMFFMPLEGFLINETLVNRQEGRINRTILDRVWTWISRDLMPGDVRMVLDQAANTAVSGERIDALVQALRSRSVDAIGHALHRSETSEKERRLISVEVGGERGLAELQDIHKVFAAEKWLLPFLQKLPDRINEHRLKQDHDVLRLVDKCANRFPDHVPIVAAALVDRSETPSALCAFAGRLAGDGDPKIIADSQFSPFVDVVLSEAERLQILALDHRNNNPDPVAFSQALSDYHTLVRGVERDIDLSLTGKWQKQLSETKRTLSGEVTRELNSAHGSIRRALQLPKVGKDGQLLVDQAAIDEAVRTLRVVTIVRNASESFAVSEVSKRTRQSVEQTLEIVTRSLISDLGKAQTKDLDAQLAAVDTAIMLSEIYYGTDYAAQLRRSRQSAVAKSKDGTSAPNRTPERKLVANALGRG